MRKRHRKILVAAVLSALASMAILASAANAATPAPPYEDFAGCPAETENEFINTCEKVEFTGGQISFGNRNVPVSNTIVLRGGIEAGTGNFVANDEGDIVPVRQTVPGGVIGMTGLDWLDEFSNKALKLYATVELAGDLGSFHGSVLNMPVKLHLESPLLGNGCYVGSATAPIDLNLTTGTTNPPAPNVPISGHLGTPLAPEAERPEVAITTGGLFVDDAYAAPAAAGCQLEIGNIHVPVDKLVNAAYKLPAAAGTNTTMLDYNIARVLPEVIYPEG